MILAKALITFAIETTSAAKTQRKEQSLVRFYKKLGVLRGEIFRLG
jgi:hypothetical protein